MSILATICLVIWLTHLHKRFYHYHYITELVSHIVRSYFLLAIILVPVILFFSPGHPTSQLVLYVAGLMVLHLLSALVYFYFLRKERPYIRKGIDNNLSCCKAQNTGLSEPFVLNNDLEAEIKKLLSAKNVINKEHKSQISQNQILILNTCEDLNQFSTKSICTIVLLKSLENIKDINGCLISFFHNLKTNAILAVRLIPLEYKQEYLELRIGQFWYKVVYPFYFFWFRALPKIRLTGSLHLFLTGGKHRWISKTEIIGRLYYCGFEILSTHNEEPYLVLIVRKHHDPMIDKEPSYHALVKLERVGFGGEIIKIHKLRTMYPYSEFLQKKVYDENQLAATGKFNNDYRITNLGKFFRKYWIDEIPQLIDWLRGYIKVVGIRAMSTHYFSLYPDEYKTLYKQVKPTIITFVR